MAPIISDASHPALYPKAWKNGIDDEVAVALAQPDDLAPVAVARAASGRACTSRPSGSRSCPR